MIVVSNTSPLTNLAAIGQFDLLYRQFGSVHIARGVAEELSYNGQAQTGHGEVARADWIHRHTVQNTALATALRYNVGFYLGDAFYRQMLTLAGEA